MDIGKLPNELLEKLIIGALEKRRAETIVKPAVGEDCCVLDLGDNLCVVSTDPITAANENAGLLSVTISLNDLASSGAQPVGILTTALLPPGISENEIAEIFKSINQKCKELGIDVLGGHTEITDAVNKTILVTTAIGKVEKGKLVTSGGASAGDDILMTKAAGLEGTAIIASDKRESIKDVLTTEEIGNAKGFINEISVLKDGLIAAENGATAMHDVTEGGILGAVWEICRASGRGAQIDTELIPVRDETDKICRHLNLNPYKLISSGSMLITCPPESSARLCAKMHENDVACTRIGSVTKGLDIYDSANDKRTAVEPPGPDEIYKVFNA